MPTHDVYPSTVEEEIDQQLADKLDDAVAALPDDLRDVVEAVDIACLSQREAGRMLGIDHKTVGRRLKRAHELLAAAIDEQADDE
jgi:RNA polymerase sigma factor (sigma-70 family)